MSATDKEEVDELEAELQALQKELEVVVAETEPLIVDLLEEVTAEIDGVRRKPNKNNHNKRKN